MSSIACLEFSTYIQCMLILNVCCAVNCLQLLNCMLLHHINSKRLMSWRQEPCRISGDNKDEDHLRTHVLWTYWFSGKSLQYQSIKKFTFRFKKTIVLRLTVLSKNGTTTERKHNSHAIRKRNGTYKKNRTERTTNRLHSKQYRRSVKNVSEAVFELA